MEEEAIKAGKVVAQVRDWIVKEDIVKKGKKLYDITEEIESKIKELGAEPAFPTNLSINEIAAHYTPSHDDETLAHGLIKVDFGAHIEGFAADNAMSFDLEENEENQKLIAAAKAALKAALNVVEEKKDSTTTQDIGEAIQTAAHKHNTLPIVNLSGHSMEQYDLHAGLTIPNIKNEQARAFLLTPGLYAIEPFVTTQSGSGKIYDGKPSGIYQLTEEKNVRSPSAREVLAYIGEEYGTLPFCSRWLHKKFGSRALLALRELERADILHHYNQLIETSGNKVAQAEHSVLITKDKVVITTKN